MNSPPKPARRIVSLLPAATEMVCILGGENRLVGRSHECDAPASVRKLPVCTQTLIDSHASSKVIDDQVKDRLKHGLSIYNVDQAALRALNPDLIITQAHCDVCAVTPASLGDAGKGIRVLSLSANNLGGVWEDMGRVAQALGREDRGRPVIDLLLRRVEDISQKARAAGESPRAACLEWLDPLMAAGNWVPELVSLAGGFNLFGAAGVHSPWLSWEELVDKDPDYILALPCGFDIERTRREIRPLLVKKEWLHLQAVYNNRVFLIDGNQYFNRPGPRLVDSLEILAEILHPELFDFGHKMTGWQYL